MRVTVVKALPSYSNNCPSVGEETWSIVNPLFLTKAYSVIYTPAYSIMLMGDVLAI